MAIKNIEVLEKSLKLESGTLQKAIDNEETVDVELQELVVRTKEEDETNLTNIRTELKDEFQTAGLEVAVKAARTEHNLEFEGKTVNNLLEAFKAKTLKDAEIEPNKRIEELETDIGKVRENLTASELKFTDLTADVAKGKSQTAINSAIMGSIKGDTTLSKSQMVTLFNDEHQTERNEDGVLVIKKNGEVLKNTTDRSLLTIDQVMTDFAKPFLKQAAGGGGGGDETGNHKEGTLAAFKAEMKEKNVGPSSNEFQLEMQKRIKDKTLVM